MVVNSTVQVPAGVGDVFLYHQPVVLLAMVSVPVLPLVALPLRVTASLSVSVATSVGAITPL